MTDATVRSESSREPAAGGRLVEPHTERSLLHVAPLLGFLILAGFAAVAAAQPTDPIAALEARVEDLEGVLDTLFTITGTTLAGTVLAIVVGWFRLVKKADRLARKQVDRIVESYPGAVERLVQEHETEARLRREARVAVVSDSLDQQALLREHGFRNLTTLFPVQATSQDLEPFAAVVLDLTAGLSQSVAAEIIRNHPRDVFLAYSTAPGRLELPAGRSTFANSPITLYARLMELLEFHEARRSII